MAGREVRCARPGCRYRKHSEQGHGFCCRRCAWGEGHGPACEHLPFCADGFGLDASNTVVLGQAEVLANDKIAGRVECEETQVRTSVAYWGIADVKYDNRLPQDSRIVVLELGDGCTSGFSQHGRPIKERFADGYCMEAKPLRCAVLVENKKLTHDRFIDEGFARLRPPTGCYARRYHQDLAGRILEDLGLENGTEKVVLKLCNRSRGAGIVVVPRTMLDEVLQKLLNPPSGADLLELLDRSAKVALEGQFEEALAESCLHWWSNECPLFLAERCCHSLPVTPSGNTSASGTTDARHMSESYDGTMRVSFVLRRCSRNGDSVQDSQEDRGDTNGLPIEPFLIEWLGGYWKLPRSRAPLVEGPAAAESQEDSLEDAHARLVSSFNSSEKLTAEVDSVHFQEVCDALSPALPRIFQRHAITVPCVMKRYKVSEPLFCAFVLVRIAASIRLGQMDYSLELVETSRSLAAPYKNVQASHGLSDGACIVLSYIDRTEAVCYAIRKAWEDALVAVERSIEGFPTNASAYYVKGVVLQGHCNMSGAATCMLRSIALDPDFKLPYIALSSCQLQLSNYEMVLAAGEACLRRFPDSPVAQFNIGQALYQMVWGMDGKLPEEELIQMRSQALHALRIARQHALEQWKETDESKLRYVLWGKGGRKTLPKQPVSIWHAAGWRP